MKNCPSCPATLICLVGYRLETYRCGECQRLIVTQMWRDDVPEDESCVIATFTTGLNMWPVLEMEHHLNPELVEAASRCCEEPFTDKEPSKYNETFLELCTECEEKGEGDG